MSERSSGQPKHNNDNLPGRGLEASGRAERFPIRIPIRYRNPRHRAWLVGSTENVSRSGVLFRTERIFELAATLDLRLEIPPINDHDGVHAEVVCKGEVVRVEEAHDAGVSPAVAVAINCYRLAQKRLVN